MNQEAYLLSITNVLRGPVLDQVIQRFHLPPGSRGLDVGCGIGLQAIRLAQAVGAGGHVTGIDSSQALLEQAQEIAAQSRLSDRIAFRQGDWNELPFEDGEFDWVWSCDSAGYADPEPLRVIQELKRVIRPGGRLAVSFWSAQALLPGNPALEARLNATRAGLAPFSEGMPPEGHCLRALGWLRAAGLVELRAETFAGSVSAPLDENRREALSALLEMRWGGAGEELSPEDEQAFRRLCRPGSPEFILDCPDYHAFFTYSAFYGRVEA